MAKEMKVINHGTGKIDLSHIGLNGREIVPRELHFKEDGATNDQPSFAMVHNHGYFCQFSLSTLRECLNELGYEIIKK